MGRADPSAYLAVPDAIRFGEELMPGGWSALRARNHDMALTGRDRLCHALDVAPPAPDEMLGAMAQMRLCQLKMAEASALSKPAELVRLKRG